MERRKLLTGLAALAVTALLPACTTEYSFEQSDPSGLKARVSFPRGESYLEEGNCLMYIPKNYLIKNSSPVVSLIERDYLIALGVKLEKPIVNLSGIINIRNLGYRGWDFTSPVGDLGQEHNYRIEWDKQGIQYVLWDNYIANRVPIPSASMAKLIWNKTPLL